MTMNNLFVPENKYASNKERVSLLDTSDKVEALIAAGGRKGFHGKTPARKKLEGHTNNPTKDLRCLELFNKKIKMN